jgi:ribosomal protein S27AE
MMRINCPDCGNTLVAMKHNGIIMQKCNCGYVLNTVSGEESRQNLNEQNDIVLCPKCGGKNRFPAHKGMIKLTCGHCSNTFIHNSGMAVSAGPQNIQQPQAAPKPAPQVQPKPEPQVQPESIPQVQPKPAPQVQSKPEPQVQPEPIPTPQAKPCRTITIERLTHAYKEWDMHGLKKCIYGQVPGTHCIG